MQITAQELAFILNAEIDGNPNAIVNKLDKIEEAGAQSLCFIANPKYEHFATDTYASVVVVSKDFSIKNKNGTTYLRVENPYQSFSILLDKFAGMQTTKKTGKESPCFVHETATIARDVYIGAFTYIGAHVVLEKGVQIHPNCVIADGSHIKENTILYPNVSVYANTQIGADCIIHSGVVIGSDGFGFAPQADGTYKKVPQTGTVKIGNKVEIGANTVIDCATLGHTEIKDGVKIDNLVQIAHNVVLGENTVVASQAGISGSTKLGKNVMVGGQAGFVGHITIADGVKINAQSGVSKSVIEKNAALSGSPAESFRQHYKNIAYTRQLEGLLKRIDELEKEVSKLKG